MNWVPERQTAYKEDYLEVLATLQASKKKATRVVDEQVLDSPSGQSPAHTALIFKSFLAKHGIFAVLDHPSYSPGLAPCGFLCLVTVEAVKENDLKHFLNSKKFE